MQDSPQLVHLVQSHFEKVPLHQQILKLFPLGTRETSVLGAKPIQLRLVVMQNRPCNEDRTKINTFQHTQLSVVSALQNTLKINGLNTCNLVRAPQILQFSPCDSLTPPCQQRESIAADGPTIFECASIGIMNVPCCSKGKHFLFSHRNAGL